ncbi:MICOS complex subunit MIC27 [Cheilinus undulatus]|uniref:MICOS complex subunit MIC27 n=1 Tax=Cheilinus undulatus TaxID=241271 RepID=UPI001BD27AEF|nr:MICOS complex subunit MIC27 [Cheilinus undulatus]
MAAKVAIVAVPTVLGLASLRVYTISETPTDGLITREKLNIYTPVPHPATAHFIPESPGVIQRGLTTARETVQPFVLAVKGAYVSVKTGSVNLYHAGEDVYYYLKDPPPGFLPRFGTITMAGLLGMFLARKGSRFKRVALPVGLMSAGASVCYPAQAVAVLKVTGKKVYAAGQWSGATVSSLFTSKPQEPGAKDDAASQPQAAAVPIPESVVVNEASEPSSVQSSSIPETEVKSAESVPLSEEPIVAVVKEDVSSVTLTEISPDQIPTEANTDPAVHLVPAETETNTASEEISAPVGSEPSGTKVEAEDLSTDVSPAEAPPVESAPVESAPVEPTPVEAAPVEPTPVEAAPVEPAPVEAAPVEPAPVEPAPVEPTPVEAAPVAPSPVAPAPVEAAPVESAPVEPAPVEAAPAEPVLSSEELPASKASDEPLVPVAESADPIPAAVEEKPTLTEPAPVQPTEERPEGGSGFKPDPALMDFGQSSPEDEDLYSTRS